MLNLDELARLKKLADWQVRKEGYDVAFITRLVLEVEDHIRQRNIERILKVRMSDEAE